MLDKQNDRTTQHRSRRKPTSWNWHPKAPLTLPQSDDNSSIHFGDSIIARLALPRRVLLWILEGLDACRLVRQVNQFGKLTLRSLFVLRPLPACLAGEAVWEAGGGRVATQTASSARQ